MDKIYFNQAVIAQPMAEGVSEAMAQWATLDRDRLLKDTREQLCQLFDGEDSDKVVFAENLDNVFEQLLQTLFQPGDHVLVSSLESDGVMAALERAGHEAGSPKTGGIEYTKIPCNEKGQLILFDPIKDKDVFAAVEALIQPNTKGLILNHGSEVCGSVLQAKELGEFAKKHHLFFILNTTQTAGYVPISMKQWHVDALLFDGGYGLLGPKEACGYIVSERVRHLVGEGDISKVNIKAIAGLHKALDFVLGTKIQFLCGNGQKMAEYFIRKLQHVSGVHIVGPGYKDRVPILSIQTDFMSEEAAAEKLEKDWGIVVSVGCQNAENAHKALGTYPRGTLNFSFGYFTNIKEMERLVKAMWQLTVQTDVLPAMGSSFMPKE